MKKLFLLAVLLLAVMSFAACGGNDPERRTLVMGTNAAFFPFEFIADYGQGVIGQYAGIDVSLVARIADELNVDIIIQDQEFAGLILALQNREIDFIAAAMTIRPDRAEQVNFTVPYFNAGQYIIVQASNTAVNSMADLAGKVVGVQLGTTGDIAVSEGHADGVVVFQEILTYFQPVTGIMDLMNGSIDAFVVDAPVARGFLATHPGELRVFADPDGFFGPEQFGMAFHLEDTELLAEFNSVLERLIAEGVVDYLYEYYTTKLGLDE
jgi:polar amino acid transport system substrate-binding protein